MFCSASRFAFAVFREAVASETSKIAPFGVHLSLYFGIGRGSTYGLLAATNKVK